LDNSIGQGEFTEEQRVYPEKRKKKIENVVRLSTKSNICPHFVKHKFFVDMLKIEKAVL
jgi:hypothetical protein